MDGGGCSAHIDDSPSLPCLPLVHCLPEFYRRVDREGEFLPLSTNCAVVAVDPPLLCCVVFATSRTRSRLTAPRPPPPPGVSCSGF
jgi:hypothetical protein